MKHEDEEEMDLPDLPVDNTVLPPTDQASMALRLQSKWLRAMEAKLDNNTITPTEMSTLARVLERNGWQFDMARMPKNLGDKLTSKVDPAELDEDENDGVLPFQRKATGP